MQNKNYLKFTSLSKTLFWDFYSLSNKNSIFSNYPIVKLREVIIQRKGSITINDGEKYKRCRVQVQAKGVILRDEVIGKEIKTKKQQLCKKDDFLVAEIDAKVGGYGIVPYYLENAIVSSHYFLFEIDKKKLTPEFLGIVIKLYNFSKQVKSTGSTNYAAIRPYHVLEYEIPLPSLEEQNRIVDNYSTKLQLAQQQEEQAKTLEIEIERYLFEELGFDKQKEKISTNTFLTFINYKNFDRWDGKNNAVFNSKYNILKFGKCISGISTGTTPSTTRKDYFNGNINFYTPADLTNEMYLNKSERTVTKLAIDERKARKFEKGTLLFVGIGSTVGKVGIINNEYATSNQQITGIELNSNLLDIEYTYYYFDFFKSITTKEKTQATIPIVNQDKILNIPIPVPPIEKQKQISNHVNSIKTQIKELNVLSAKNKEEAIVEFENEIFN